MRQEIITLYKIKELNDTAREKAFYHFLSDHDLDLFAWIELDCLVDFKEHCLISASFKDCDYSIGDRNSYFKLKDYELDYNEIALKNLSSKEYNQLLRLFKTIGYDSICNDLDSEKVGSNYRVNKLAEKWISICEYHLDDINETIRLALESEYEYQTSMDYFIEVSECNEWEYDSTGRMV